MTQEMLRKIRREIKTGRIWRRINRHGHYCRYVRITLPHPWQPGGTFQMAVGIGSLTAANLNRNRGLIKEVV